VHRLRPRLIASSLLATTVAISACGGGTTSSSDGGEGGAPIAAGALYINATVAAEDDTTAEVSVTLHNGSLFGNYVLLTGGDALSVCVGAQCSPLTREPPFSDYEAELPYVAETPYTISLARAGANANSVVALPVPFTILAPAPDLRVTDGDSVTVQWAPAGTSDTVNVETLCYYDGFSLASLLPRARFGQLATNVDSGTVVTDVDTLLDIGWSFFSRQEPIERCDIRMEIVRGRLGTIDASFGGGFVRGLASRKVRLDYEPRP
jgi:hypothetical protein